MLPIDNIFLQSAHMHVPFRAGEGSVISPLRSKAGVLRKQGKAAACGSSMQLAVHQKVSTHRKQEPACSSSKACQCMGARVHGWAGHNDWHGSSTVQRPACSFTPSLPPSARLVDLVKLQLVRDVLVQECAALLAWR